MYKEATRLKLRFPSNRGELTVEQLWDLSLNSLKNIVKSMYDAKKKFTKMDDELSFLEGVENSEEQKLAELRYNIVKDIYTTKANENKKALSTAEKKAKKQQLLEIMQRKREQKFENMSEEELQKEIDSLGV